MRSRANPGRFSVALALSYAFDWVIIIAAAGVGAAFSSITPNKRPFSLANPEISFPHVLKEKVSLAVLIVCGLVIPAAIIFLVAILLVPGPTVSKSTPKTLTWKRKLWEWHTGWLGLALSLAAAFLITNGIKNLIGKPRPDLLSRCNPDIANIGLYIVGGFNNTQGVNLVSQTICQNTDKSVMDDGFRSFPSGHSSFSAAGLIYLSLFLASKLGITIPYLSPSAYNPDRSQFSAFPSRASQTGPESGEQLTEPSGHNDSIIAARNQAAAPPVYLLAIAIVPWFASIYIASSRYSDFRHHGFDILFGYFIGTVTAIFAFRYYHLPISQGAGWSWGPRSRDRSFWAGIGVGNYAGRDHRHEDGVVMHDLEQQPKNDVSGAGLGGKVSV